MRVSRTCLVARTAVTFLSRPLVVAVVQHGNVFLLCVRVREREREEEGEG